MEPAREKSNILAPSNTPRRHPAMSLPARATLEGIRIHRRKEGVVIAGPNNHPAAENQQYRSRYQPIFRPLTAKQ